MNETNLRFTVVFIAVMLHLAIIIFVVFDIDTFIPHKPQESRTIILLDLDELLPEPSAVEPQPQPQPRPQPAPQPVIEPQIQPIFQAIPQPVPQEESEIPLVEEIAEIMIEADPVPEQEIVAAGTLRGEPVDVVYATAPAESEEVYVSQGVVSVLPSFDDTSLTADLVYPLIAQRSGIEGRVILELFVDRTGTVQRVTILLEDPQARGFGDAAVNLFMGRQGTPAYDSNGQAVSCRFRRVVQFRLR